MTFSREEMVRWSRQILLPEVGGRGQRALGAATVLLVASDEAGRTAAAYLAAAGVGHLMVVSDDDDAVPPHVVPRGVSVTRVARGNLAQAAASADLLALAGTMASTDMTRDAALAGRLVAPASGLDAGPVLEGAWVAAEVVRRLLGMTDAHASSGNAGGGSAA